MFLTALAAVALLAASCVLLISPARSATVHHYGPHACQYVCQVRVARKQCSNARPRACVTRAIVQYRLTGWQSAWMRRIPVCESDYDPLASNPAPPYAKGLYQFIDETWASTPYGRYSVFKAKWASLAAAWMLKQGRSGEWECT